MGQYYLIANIDKEEYLYSHIFGDGLKLLEFGLSGEGMMAGLAILLADGNGRGGGDLNSDDPLIGSWAGSRIVITGDYADEGKFLPKAVAKKPCTCDDCKKSDAEKGKKKKSKPPNLYHYADAFYTDISKKVLMCMAANSYICENLVKERRIEKCPKRTKDAMPVSRTKYVTVKTKDGPDVKEVKKFEYYRYLGPTYTWDETGGPRYAGKYGNPEEYDGKLDGRKVAALRPDIADTAKKKALRPDVVISTRRLKK